MTCAKCGFDTDALEEALVEDQERHILIRFGRQGGRDGLMVEVYPALHKNSLPAFFRSYPNAAYFAHLLALTTGFDVTDRCRDAFETELMEAGEKIVIVHPGNWLTNLGDAHEEVHL